MITLLYILMILACIIIVVSVLLQPSKGGGMSALGGSNQSVFGSTGGNSFLFNATMWAAAFIMVAALVLSRYQIMKNKTSVFDELPATTSLPQSGTPADPAKTIPASPTSPTPMPAPGAAKVPVTGPVNATVPSK